MGKWINKTRFALSILICGFAVGLFIANLLLPLFGENLGITLINHFRMAMMMFSSMVIFIAGIVIGPVNFRTKDMSYLDGRRGFMWIGIGCVAFLSIIFIGLSEIFIDYLSVSIILAIISIILVIIFRVAYPE